MTHNEKKRQSVEIDVKIADSTMGRQDTKTATIHPMFKKVEENEHV